MGCVAVKIGHGTAPSVQVGVSDMSVSVGHVPAPSAKVAFGAQFPSLKVDVQSKASDVRLTVNDVSQSVNIEEVCFQRYNDEEAPVRAVCCYAFAEGEDQGSMSLHEFTERLELEAAALKQDDIIPACADGDIRGETITFRFTKPCLWILTPSYMVPFTSARDVGTDLSFAIEDTVECNISGVIYKARRSNAMDIGTVYTVRFY